MNEEIKFAIDPSYK